MNRRAVITIAMLGSSFIWNSPTPADAPATVEPAAQPAPDAPAPTGDAPPPEGRPERRRRGKQGPGQLTPEMIEAMREAGAPVPSTGPTTGPTTNATTGPSTSPTTAATTTSTSGVAPTPPFPKEYDLLLKRSMFARGKPKAEKPGGDAQGPEGNFGLRGVGVQDGQFIALIEDSSQKSTKGMKQGESIATGKIKSIDIDGMVYEGKGGKTQKVTIGQNLLGAPLPPPPAPPPKPATPPPGQPGQPGQLGQPGQPGEPQMVPGRRNR